jgi:hypothetical protein
MPWLYFDGKLFQQKYNEAKWMRATQERLCEDKVIKIPHRNDN